MNVTRKGTVFGLLAMALAVSGLCAYWILGAGNGKTPPPGASAAPTPEKLDPSTDRLTAPYLDSRLLESFIYEETPYPASFSGDGLGSLSTRPFAATFVEPLAPSMKEWLLRQYGVLERHPRDLKSLEGIVTELGRHPYQTRIVPFMDRYLAAGGKGSLATMTCYVPGLARLGRYEEALRHFTASERQWDRMSDTMAGYLFRARFTQSWIVQRSLAGMLDAFEQGVRTALYAQDIYYIQEVFCENLRRAVPRGELPWFLDRMDRHWKWFTESALGAVVEIVRGAKLQPSESLLAAADPICRGLEVAPQALRMRAIESLKRGEPDVAMRQSQRDVELARSAGSKELLQGLLVLARVHREREEIEKAFDVTAEVERLAADLKFEPGTGWAKILRGFLYEKVGDYRRAAGLYSEAYALGAKLNYDELRGSSEDHYERALCQTGLAEDVETSLRKKALASTERNLISNISPAYRNWGMCLNRLGRHDEAIEAFRTATDGVRERVGANYTIDRAILVSCLEEMGFALLARKRFAEAEKTYDRCAEASKASVRPSGWWKWQLGKAKARLGLGDREGATRWIRECLQTIEAQRANLTDFKHRRTLNDNKYEAYTTAVGMAVDRGDEAGAFALAEQSRARTFLDEFGAHATSGKTIPQSDLNSLTQVCQDFAAVVYFQLPDRLLAWVIHDGKAVLEVLPHSAVQVEDTVETLLTSIYLESYLLRRYVGEGRPKSNATTVSRRLHQKIWAPLAARLQKAKRICIIPHQTLHYVPFQALFDGEKFLIETKNLFYAASGSSLQELRRRPALPAGSLTVIDALLSDDRRSPFFNTETKVLQEERPDAQFLIRERATVSTFKENAVKAGILHVSSHGHFNPWIPLDSGLKLSPDTPGGDGLLRARDIYDLRFTKTFLAVVSACVSSVGELAGGDEVTGLTRAFQIAGVPNVIGSLWPVENEATTDLMTRLHWELQATGDPVDALRAAQRRLIENNRPVSQWAGFQVTGDGRKAARK